MSSSSSSFIQPGSFSKNWSDIEHLSTRSRNVLYTGVRYGRRFLLKALRPEHQKLTDYAALHDKEFRLGISLSHPNIAATFSLENVADLGPCIVQEYIDGVTLDQWLEQKPTTAQRSKVLQQLLDALQYLHERQLVHHDLHGKNILITTNSGNVKLIDFGLSDTDDSTTPRPNDPQSDIKAVGKIIAKLFPRQYLFIRHRCAVGSYGDITALRRAIERRTRTLRALPNALLIIALAVAVAVLYGAYRRQNVQLEQMQQKMANDVDIEEIKTVLQNVYQPVYDSLQLADSRYTEIAQLYVSIPNTSEEYQKLAARYPEGSEQHYKFTKEWNAVKYMITEDIFEKVTSLPSYIREYQDGRLPEDEYLRLKAKYLSTVKRLHSQ